jgi:hypothetical protein
VADDSDRIASSSPHHLLESWCAAAIFGGSSMIVPDHPRQYYLLDLVVRGMMPVCRYRPFFSSPIVPLLFVMIRSIKPGGENLFSDVFSDYTMLWFSG